MFEFDSSDVGAYADERNEVVVLEINDGVPLARVILTPEEAEKLAQDLVREAALLLRLPT